jgi:hypothetical protein
MAEEIKKETKSTTLNGKSGILGFITGCVCRLAIRLVISYGFTTMFLKLGIGGGFWTSSLIGVTSYWIAVRLIKFVDNLMASSADFWDDPEEKQGKILSSSVILDVILAISELVYIIRKSKNNKEP